MPEQSFNHFALDIDVPGLGEVWLRGEEATGYPTQTWLNGELLLHKPEGVFSWASDAGVPTSIWHLDRLLETSVDGRMLCLLLAREAEIWDRRHPGESEASRARAAAYVQYARLLASRYGCTVPVQ